jgi:hypothetical protein
MENNQQKASKEKIDQDSGSLQLKYNHAGNCSSTIVQSSGTSWKC